MYKSPILGTLVLIGIIGLVAGFYNLSSFAQEEEKEETITITTYYPSPYGSYKELEMHEGAIFRPHNSAGDYVEDLDCNADKEGKLVYGKKDSSVTEDTWYYCDGSEWKSLTSGASLVLCDSCGKSCVQVCREAGKMAFCFGIQERASEAGSSFCGTLPNIGTHSGNVRDVPCFPVLSWNINYLNGEIGYNRNGFWPPGGYAKCFVWASDGRGRFTIKRYNRFYCLCQPLQ